MAPPPSHLLRRMQAALPPRVLTPLGLVVGLVWGVIALADQVGDGSTQKIDEAVLLALRTDDPSDPIGPVWVEEVARDITALGGTTVLVIATAIVLLYLALSQRLRAMWIVMFSIPTGLISITLLKLVFARPRPSLVPHGQEVYLSSFPSGHAMGSALTYLTLAALLARIEPLRRTQVFLLTVAFSLTVMVGISRVYLGVHYPTDVFAGWGVGCAWALITWVAADRLADPRQ